MPACAGERAGESSRRSDDQDRHGGISSAPQAVPPASTTTDERSQAPMVIDIATALATLRRGHAAARLTRGADHHGATVGRLELAWLDSCEASIGGPDGRRRAGLWSARSRAIPRRLVRIDAGSTQMRAVCAERYGAICATGPGLADVVPNERYRADDEREYAGYRAPAGVLRTMTEAEVSCGVMCGERLSRQVGGSSTSSVRQRQRAKGRRIGVPGTVWRSRSYARSASSRARMRSSAGHASTRTSRGTCRAA